MSPSVGHRSVPYGPTAIVRIIQSAKVEWRNSNYLYRRIARGRTDIS